MMKKLILVVLVVCFGTVGLTQEITGDWNSILKAGGQELPLVFHIQHNDTGYQGSLDSPKQGAFDLKASAVAYTDGTLTFIVAQLGASYEGILDTKGDLEGTFSQGGLSFPLVLTKGEAKVVIPNRPQEPKGPFPYTSEEVTFKNTSADIKLAGTLTLPENKGNTSPAVILISGSGPQDRNEELLDHKPFLVLADYLSRRGIAVLRYDDRGTAQSAGTFQGATSADFATDAQAAFDFLKTHSRIDATKIGFAGHSEGGLIAPMVAAQNKEVAFIALLAGVGQPGDELLTEQGYLIGKAQGLSEDVLRRNRVGAENIYGIVKTYYGDTPKIKEEITNYLKEALAENPDLVPDGMTIDEAITQQINTVTTDWFQYLIKTDPRPTLQKVSCPVLAINGSLDLQVPPKQNLGNIEAALKKGKNNSVTIVEIPNLNHLFQTTETGNPSEYATIEETFSPKALKIIANWISKTTQ